MRLSKLELGLVVACLRQGLRTIATMNDNSEELKLAIAAIKGLIKKIEKKLAKDF